MPRAGHLSGKHKSTGLLTLCGIGSMPPSCENRRRRSDYGPPGSCDRGRGIMGSTNVYRHSLDRKKGLPLWGNPAGEIEAVFPYRFMFMSSASISSVVVMMRELAWKPRWVMIILTNSVAKSTFDCSNEFGLILPKEPFPGALV